MSRVQFFFDFYKKINEIIDFINDSEKQNTLTSLKSFPAEIRERIMLDPGLENISSCIIELIHATENISSSYTEQQMEEFKFLLAAMADELIPTSTSVKTDSWLIHSVENKIFQTMIAGDRLIQKLQSFLEYHNRTESEMGLVYYYLIKFGYKGKFKYDSNTLKSLEKKIYLCIIQECDITPIESVVHISPVANMNVINVQERVQKYNYKYLYIKCINLVMVLIAFLIMVAIAFDLTINKNIK